MHSTLQLNITPLPKQISHNSKILLTGSCFAEHIADKLQEHKFDVLSNRHGVIYNPYSIVESLNSYIEGKMYNDEDLFHLNEIWNSWEHHTRFSHIDKEEALRSINHSQGTASHFIREATHIIISLGTAFYHSLKESGKIVSNNHKAPSQWFDKKLAETNDIVNLFTATIHKIKNVNPGVHFIFTVSPVRHIREGLVENNRSKGRLLDAVHAICEQNERAYYFPSYELVTDVLRDYRYFKDDMVHPDSKAVDYVWKQFINVSMNDDTKSLLSKIEDINTASLHRPRFPETEQHRKFKKSYADKVAALQQQYPYLDWTEENNYFNS